MSDAITVVPPRIAVLGCGYWGKNLVRVMSSLGHLAAISDADSARADAMAAQYSTKALSFDKILSDPSIDGVVIATPAEMHASQTMMALEAGKHVFVEKPLALRVRDARQAVRLAQTTGKTLMVGHLLQYHPAFSAMKALIASGRLGRLQYIYSNRLNLGKIRREENVFWSFAPHDISMILSLADAMPTQIHAVGANYLHQMIADVSTTHLSFASGLNAHIFVSWLHPFKEQKLVVVGEEGMAVFDDRQPWAEKLLHYPHRIIWRNGLPEPEQADAESVPLSESEPLRDEMAHFIHCITTGSRPRTDGEEGLRVLTVLSAAEQAMAERRPVLVESESEAPSPAIHPTASVHVSSFVDEGATIGEGSRIWHFSHILGGVTIGRNCTIGQNVMIGPDVTVGQNCKIQNNVSLYKGVKLSDGVFCGPSSVFTNVNAPRAEVDRKSEFLPTPVGRGATIGANATIVCGHSLGEYCFIAAGAVVASDVPHFALMAGVPARRIGWVGYAGERLGPDLRCPRTGQVYRLNGPDSLIPDSSAPHTEPA